MIATGVSSRSFSLKSPGLIVNPFWTNDTVLYDCSSNSDVKWTTRGPQDPRLFKGHI